jgi:hypothetical protein
MMFNRNSHPLTLAEIGSVAPSALAVSEHSSRSDRYTYIPTSEIINGMEREGFLPFSATQSRCRDASRREFTKHLIRFRQMSDITRAAIVGELVPEIVLVNAHDGSAAYSLMAGLWRFACGNGMMVSDSTLASIHIRHSGDVVGQLIEGSLKIAEQSQKALEQVGNWRQLQLSSGEQSAFAEAAHTLRFADAEGQAHTPITAAQLLHLRRTEDNGSDLWSTLNRVQENCLKGGLTAVARDENGRRLRRVNTRQVKGIDQDVKLNRALWQLAEKMAELKAA